MSNYLGDPQLFTRSSLTKLNTEFSNENEKRVPFVPCTPQITKVDHVPPIKELIGLRGRYFAGQGLSSELIHHVLHESDDASTSSAGHIKHEEHIPLDLGTQTLQRIIDQLKTLMTLSRSDPSASEAFNAGLPRYCQYLKGEKGNKPSFLSLEDILAKTAK